MVVEFAKLQNLPKIKEVVPVKNVTIFLRRVLGGNHTAILSLSGGIMFNDDDLMNPESPNWWGMQIVKGVRRIGTAAHGRKHIRQFYIDANEQINKQLEDKAKTTEND